MEQKVTVNSEKKKWPSQSFNSVHLGHNIDLQSADLFSKYARKSGLWVYVHPKLTLTGLADSKDITLHKENIFPYMYD